MNTPNKNKKLDRQNVQTKQGSYSQTRYSNAIRLEVVEAISLGEAVK